MQQSNFYIIIFSVALTVVVGGLLSFTSEVLKPAQKKSVELDTKMQILSAVMNTDSIVENSGKSSVLDIYSERITSLIVDINGNPVDVDDRGNPIVAEDVNIARNYRFDPEERLYPVFRYMSASDPDKIEAYILPLYGNGLWDKIWGFVAVDADMETIAGVSFAHKGETPGLGARIADKDIQSRFAGKKIYDEDGNLVSVEMVKGEQGGGQASIDQFADSPHKVDGMSGATITAKGVNVMLENYLGYYQSYFSKVESEA